MARTAAVPLPCPCGRTDARGRLLPHAQCCGPYLAGPQALSAPDAQSLMRSRYSAFVQGRADYLLATWHASTRPAQLDLDPATRWLGLEVRAHRALGADHAEVEFIARFRVAGRAVRQHERSRFVRELGRWWYVDGDVL
ncbi:YchJ family protein [Comamonas granuli]|uniref:YchJ family protein n=1 Tax=Comamonas granuli TaxID=290309 RepID=UPI0005A7308F|nr:YchJ family metal-binding protein [Comamonas granuli]